MARGRADEEVARRIQLARRASGLTQEEAADRLQTTPAYISHMETGKRGVSGRMLRQMARVYGADERYLLTGQTADEVTGDPVISEILADLTPLTPRERERVRVRIRQLIEDIRFAAGGSEGAAPGSTPPPV